jgi:hypothetical protein
VARKLEPLDILDWYDGIVLGVVRLNWTEGLYLAALISWAQSRRLRVYALLKVESAEVEALKLLHGDWTRMRAEVHGSFARAEGDIDIVCVDETSEDVVAQKRIPVSRVADHVVSDVEEALGPERSVWLEAFGQQ